MKKINAILLCLFYAVLTACPVHPFTPTEGEIASGETSSDLVQVGKRNFWEVNAAMATVTGVTPEDHLAITADAGIGANPTPSGGNNPNAMQISKTWQEVNTMMARKNGIDGCDPGTQIGLFRLASAYCNRLIGDSAAWNNFVEQNFGGKVNISTLSKSHIAAVLLDSLQTGSKLSNTQREKSLTTIVNYMNDAGAGDSVSKETLFDVCTMVLGSASTMLN